MNLNRHVFITLTCELKSNQQINKSKEIFLQQAWKIWIAYMFYGVDTSQYKDYCAVASGLSEYICIQNANPRQTSINSYPWKSGEK